MSVDRDEWRSARDELADELEAAGFQREAADLLAKHLGGPKAIRRLSSYIRQAGPTSMEMIADETVAIREEIDAWRRKVDNREADVRYNRVIRYGIDDDP